MKIKLNMYVLQYVLSMIFHIIKFTFNSAILDGERVNSTNAAAIIASLLAVLLVIITFSFILGVVLLKFWRKKKNK